MTNFSDLGLSPETVKAVTDTGYTEPTPIQEQAIPVALAGRDVLGIAQTGTGKTAAFTLPMIDRLVAGRSKARMPRSLVVAPTRELADQVAASFDKYAKGQKLSWALLIGGVSFDDQEKKLDRGVDVLIATPGRLLDHFERGKLLLTGVQIMVVDEADRMLDMGFIPDLERIFKLVPPGRQTLFFSATMPPEITRLTSQFLKDPTRIEASRPATTADTIAQHIVKIPISDPKAKRMALRALIEREDISNALVFCNRKTEVDIVAKSLKKHGFDAAAIHGDLDQSVRTRTLEAFRKNELKILVASDVAARGLDIPACSHVFNYDVPHHADDYVHRIGRTGRAGRAGDAFMIVTPNDLRNYEKVLKLTKKTPDEVTLDLDWASAQGGDEPRERRPRGGDREQGRGRNTRVGGGEHRERPHKDHGERAAMEPLTPDAAAVGPDAEPAPAPAQRRTRKPRAEAPIAPPPSPGRAYGARPATAAPVQANDDTVIAQADATPAPAEDYPAPREVRQGYGREERPVTRAERGDRARGGVKAPAARGGEERDHDRSIVGFGSDTPAFLLRATPIRKAAALGE